MTFKKSAGIIITFISMIFMAGVLVVQSWMTTPYGKLDYRVAVYLKVTGAAEKNKEQLAMSIKESRRILAEKSAAVTGTPIALPVVKEIAIKEKVRTIPVRVYTPEGEGPFPVVIFYHGGGWVQGSLDTHDGLCRIIAKKSGAVVVSVDYRLAPEHPYPAAVDDAYSALLWVASNGSMINVDSSRIAVAGDSAGGNLAAAVTLMSRDRKGPVIRYQVLIYPGVDPAHLDTPGYDHFGQGYMLDKGAVKRFVEMYLPNEKQRYEPYAAPLLAMSHRDLPSALVITAGFDVLRDEGEAYADKLKKAGAAVHLIRYPGMVHGFISADKILPQARQATDEIARELKKTFKML